MGTEGNFQLPQLGGGTITYQWEKLDPKSCLEPSRWRYFSHS